VNKHELELDWCSHEAAKYAVEHWHYSKSLPTPPLVKIGVWEYGVYIGCVLFGRGANNNVGKPYGLKQTEVCELVRVALNDHKTPVTKIVSIALLMLCKQNKMRLCVSYADPEQGHHGGIYQGGNWIYAGTTSPDRYYITQDGKRVHSRMVCERGYKLVYGTRRKVPKPGECKEKITTSGKHRYLMPLDNEIRQRILKLSKPYPKRASSETNDTSGDQPEKGGATPTDALHSEVGD
jgi:hypothetical protein